ncbi:hypothetical protein Tco_1503205 [Tanacetum coccineum]
MFANDIGGLSFPLCPNRKIPLRACNVDGNCTIFSSGFLNLFLGRRDVRRVLSREAGGKGRWKIAKSGVGWRGTGERKRVISDAVLSRLGAWECVEVGDIEDISRVVGEHGVRGDLDVVTVDIYCRSSRRMFECMR